MRDVSLQVPAGLHVDLQVQLLATAAGESKEPQTRIHQDLVIQTELETLYLPVTANILYRPARGPQGVQMFEDQRSRTPQRVSLLTSCHPSFSGETCPRLSEPSEQRRSASPSGAQTLVHPVFPSNDRT